MIDIENLTQEQKELITAGALALATFVTKEMTPSEALIQVKTGLGIKNLGKGGTPEWFWELMTHLVGKEEEAEGKTAASKALNSSKQTSASAIEAKEALKDIPLETRQAVIVGAACFDAFEGAVYSKMGPNTAITVGTTLCTLLGVAPPKNGEPHEAVYNQIYDAVEEFFKGTGLIDDKPEDPWEALRTNISSAKKFATMMTETLKPLAAEPQEQSTALDDLGDTPDKDNLN